MSEIFTGYSIPKPVNENQLVSELKKVGLQQNIKDASSQLNRVESIFNLRETDFSSTEGVFFEKLFEKSLVENAYKNAKKDMSLLRFQEKSIDTTQSISEKKIIAHEENLKMNPEIVGIETEIRNNQQELQKKQKSLDNRTKSENHYQNILSKNSFLKEEVNQLKNVAFTLTGDIESIKEHIQQIKNGKITISDIQKNITGSTSSSAVDISKNFGSNNSLMAILNSQQISENKELKKLLKSSEETSELGKAQEETENNIKNIIIKSLESLLNEKENKLKNTQNQLKNKEIDLEENQEKINSCETDTKDNISEEDNLEQEIEELIKRNSDLVELRLKKDPELVKFSSVTNFFNNIIKGDGETGIGIVPEKARKKDSFSGIKEEYENKSSQSNSYQEMLEIKSFLKNEAKYSLDNSKSKTMEQEELFALYSQTKEN